MTATPFRLVDLESPEAAQAATDWWIELTQTGGEGMVAKPLDFIARSAMREFCIGIEALTRFVKNEPLRLVHECAFGVLALESEPLDPRL